MPGTTPTVVLVHGAFADGSSFAAVVPELLADGLPVVVPAVPNRSLTGDAAYIASVIAQIDGPVILVGHFSAPSSPWPGQSPTSVPWSTCRPTPWRKARASGSCRGRFPDSPLAAGLVYKTFPVEGSDQPGTDVYVDVAKFPGIFAADVDPDLAKVLAIGQRPLAGVAFTEKATAAAWKTKPAWGSVAINDHTINPDVERFGYQRAGMTTIEIESSHLVMLSHPKEVADLIRTAIAGGS